MGASGGLQKLVKKKLFVQKKGPAITYSPTGCILQYHRRKKA